MYRVFRNNKPAYYAMLCLCFVCMDGTRSEKIIFIVLLEAQIMQKLAMKEINFLPLC